MTAAEFNIVLESIGWSRNTLAQRLGMGSDRAVRRWSAGQNPVPSSVAAWLLLVARALEDLPPPKDWQAADTTVQPDKRE